MDTYQRRLGTFQKWPPNHPVKPENLALAGQYYTEEGDETRCYVCNKRLSGWEDGDDPYKEHKEQYPDCKLSKQPKTAIESIKPSKTGADKVDVAGVEQGVGQMDIPGKPQGQHRVEVSGSTGKGWDIGALHASFGKTWPHKGRLWPQNMALGGFKYKGEGDQVVCNFCGLELSKWEPNDIPVYEHRNHAPQCVFINRILQELKDNPPTRQLPTVDKLPDYKEGLAGQMGDEDPKPVDLSVEVEPDAMCILCRQRKRLILFEPCSHFVVCESCSQRLSHCPVLGCGSAIIKKTKYRDII